MQINLNKTLTELAPLQISDLIDVDFSVIKAVAAASNGEFIIDRATLSAAAFLAKYFADYEIYDTVEKIEARHKAEIASKKRSQRAKINRPAVMDDYGNYVVAIWESGNEFAASYRKTDHINTHWDVLSKHEIEYKIDGRRFAIVYNTNSRRDAINKKESLIESMTQRGLTNKGELPV